MDSSEVSYLRLVYSEICRGFSMEKLDKKDVYVKHLNPFDQMEIDAFYESAFDSAVRRKIDTEKSKLAWLKSNKLWDEKNESEMISQRAYVENLEKTRANLYLRAQIDNINKQIQEAQRKLYQIISKRDKLLGLTAEKVAERKVQYEYVRLALFTDKGFSKPLLSKNDIKELDDEEASLYLSLYINSIEKAAPLNIKKIALQPFFTNYFYLCNDNPSLFFGKPIVDLTVYQVNLLSYGLYYKTLMSNHKVPPEISLDPEKLEEFLTKSQNFKNVVAKTAGKPGRVGIVGATSQDMKDAGLIDGTAKMQELAGKNYKNATVAAQEMGFTYKN